MLVFPSIEWFKKVQAIYNADSNLHSGGGGACDTTAGFKVGEKRYFIEFSGLQCTEIKESSETELAQTDFIIEMPVQTWQEMIQDVQDNGKASAKHTLNSLDLDGEDGIAQSPQDDQYKQDLFYRYNQNFQDFFNASSRVKTIFE